MRWRAHLRASSGGFVRRQHVMHREPRVVDLDRETGLDDALVFLAQRLGDGEQMVFFALVEFVLHHAGAT